MANRVPDKVFINPDNNEIIRANGLYYIDPTDVIPTPHYFDGTAVVYATLYDQYDNAVAGCTNLALAYVVGSVGNFAGVVVAPFAPASGSGYKLVIDATQGAAHGRFSIDAEVTVRSR